MKFKISTYETKKNIKRQRKKCWNFQNLRILLTLIKNMCHCCTISEKD